MSRPQQVNWQRMAVKWAGLGAAAGGLLGLAFIWPAVAYGSLASVVRILLTVTFAGGSLGAAVGSLYAGKGRKWFWLVVVALGVIALPLMLLTSERQGVAMALIVAAAVLAMAFGVWVLLAAALHAWRVRRKA